MSGKLYRAAGGLPFGCSRSATNEPHPGVVTIRPSSRSAASTFRAVVLAIPYSWWIVTIEGTIVPGASSPDKIRSRRASLTRIHGGM
jgi:hypothetical protein